MRVQASLAFFLASSAWLVSAAPAAEKSENTSELRLIKTSPEDAGTWVTEEQKLSEYTAKKIGFVDITDITDAEVLAALSAPESEDATLTARAITYPTRVSHQTAASPLIAKASTSQPQSWLKTLTGYQNRYYRGTYGTQSSTWLFNTVKGVAAANPAIVVTQFTHSFNQPSIIARIPGASSDLIIVGAHQDSTAGSATARAPGADDDGSGTVTILEALRVLANAGYKPQNTIEFHWYAGEEGGLLGSAAIFSKYKSAGKNVLAMVNQDMTGYSPSGKMAIYTDYTDSALTAYTKVVATAYIGATSTSRCGYGCSDHASARSNGFPSAFVMEDVFEVTSPYIHSASDAYSTVMWDSILRHAQFTIAFLVEASYL